MQLHQSKSEFDRRDVKIVIVTFEAGFLARAYIEDTGLRWPLLIDADREIYKAYGMFEAGFWDIWGPATWWAYLKELARVTRIPSGHPQTMKSAGLNPELVTGSPQLSKTGSLPGKSAGDISQRGGDVLIDPQGIVQFHHIGRGPADRPPVGSILGILDRSQSGSRK